VFVVLTLASWIPLPHSGEIIPFGSYLSTHLSPRLPKGDGGTHHVASCRMLTSRKDFDGIGSRIPADRACPGQRQVLPPPQH
jgi:hypothetical protein